MTAIRRLPVLGVIAVVLAIGLVSAGPAYGKDKQRRKATSAAPRNDHFAQRDAVKAIPFSASVDVSRATLETGEPLCGEMTSSVWFAFTPASNSDLVVQAASDSFTASIAAYVGKELHELDQVACSRSLPKSASDEGSRPAIFSLYAERGTTYLFQVGALEAPSGILELSLAEGTSPQPFIGRPGALPRGWQERTLLEEERSHSSEGADLIRFEGRPTADGSMYEMDVWVAGNQVVDRLTLYTAGQVQGRHSYRALSPSSHTVSVRVAIRYDANNHRCLIGLGGDCTVLLPRGPEAEDVVTGKAGRAELIVATQVERRASLAPIDPVAVTLRVPLVGYAAALLP